MESSRPPRYTGHDVTRAHSRFIARHTTIKPCEDFAIFWLALQRRARVSVPCTRHRLTFNGQLLTTPRVYSHTKTHDADDSSHGLRKNCVCVCACAADGWKKKKMKKEKKKKKISAGATERRWRWYLSPSLSVYRTNQSISTRPRFQCIAAVQQQRHMLAAAITCAPRARVYRQRESIIRGGVPASRDPLQRRAPVHTPRSALKFPRRAAPSRRHLCAGRSAEKRPPRIAGCFRRPSIRWKRYTRYIRNVFCKKSLIHRFFMYKVYILGVWRYCVYDKFIYGFKRTCVRTKS